MREESVDQSKSTNNIQRSIHSTKEEEKNQLEGIEEAEMIMNSISISTSSNPQIPSLNKEGTEQAEMIFQSPDL